MQTNNACASCDYRPDCHKKIVWRGKAVLAKEQEEFDMPCVCVIQDICRDCRLFMEKKCAAWKIINGKKSLLGTLLKCPKKILAEDDVL